MMRRLRETALWAGACLGLLAVLAAVAVTWFGFSFLVFRSGSMSPEIPTGGLALSRTVPASELVAGDVVSVVSSTGDRITHRLVSSTIRGEQASLILRGDANSTDDPEIYQVTEAERVVVSVPYGGYVVAHALTPPGLVAAGAVSLMLLILGFSPPPEDRPAGPRPPSRRERRRARHRAPTPDSTRTVVGAAVATMVVLTGAVGTHVTDTLAFYTDPATARSTVAAGDLAVPVMPTSTQTPTTSIVALSWSATAAGNTTATAYEVVRYVAPTGGTATSVCTTAGALSCTDVKQTTTVYYAVRARIGGQWIEESTRTTYTPDVTGPALGLTQPRTTGTTSASMRTQVAACVPAGIICGTATDPGGVASIEYTLRRTVIAVTSCWSGTAWVPTLATTCPTFMLTTGTTSWTVPGSPATAYPNLTAASFLLTLRSTDGFGNVQNNTVSYSVTG